MFLRYQQILKNVILIFAFLSHSMFAQMSHIDSEPADVNMAPVLPQTAGFYYPAAHATALNWAEDAELLYMMGEELDDVGLSFDWTYFFYSETLDTVAIFNSGPTAVTVSAEEMGPGLHPVPDGWIDSDVALTVAEAAGAAFRSTYPDYELTAFMGSSLLGLKDFARENRLDKAAEIPKSIIHDQTMNVGMTRLGSRIVNGVRGLKIRQLNDNIEPYWFFEYIYDSDEIFDGLNIYVNAMDGSLFEGWTAREAVEAASAFLSLIGSDAVLTELSTNQCKKTGQSLRWIYEYYSSTTNNILFFQWSGDRGSGIVLFV